MEGSAYQNPPEVKTLMLFLLSTSILWPGVSGGTSPHQVYNVTWTITNLMTGERANATSVRGTLADAFPILHFDLCDLVGDTWEKSVHDPGSFEYGCQSQGQKYQIQSKEFYVCPGHKVNKNCGGPADGYCAKWGCETTGEAYWKPSSSWDLITLKRGVTPSGDQCQDNKGGRCNPLVLQFTASGKKASWDGPKSWGLRLYVTGYDPVTMFSLNRRVTNLATQSVRPNTVLKDHKPPSLPAPARPPVLLPQVTQTPNNVSVTPFSMAGGSTALTPQPPGTGDRLINLVTGVYLALNYSDPSKTQEYCLCLVSSPPYYEGVAVLGNSTNQTTLSERCSASPTTN